MSVIIDLLGALMIATMLLLMMITFQLQLRDTADRTIFAAQMMTHVQHSCIELNSLIAMAGINMPHSTQDSQDSLVVTIARPNKLSFRTWWDFSDSVMTAGPNSVTIEVGPSSPVGKQLNIIQANNPIYEFRPILWIEDILFIYYDIDGGVLTDAYLNNNNESTNITNRKKIASINVNLTFKRIPPRVTDVKPLETKIQMRCYLMNRHLKIGQSIP